MQFSNKGFPFLDKFQIQNNFILCLALLSQKLKFTQEYKKLCVEIAKLDSVGNYKLISNYAKIIDQQLINSYYYAICFHRSIIHCYLLLFRVECVRTSVVRALADVVATKLGIFLFLPSFLPLTYLPEGVCLRF